MSIRIYIADDHAMFRDGIKAMLDPEAMMEVVGESDNGATVVRECVELKPDIVLMDISMDDMDGIETTKQLKASGSKVKILAVSMHDESHYVKSMLDSGANGYILKSAGRNEMISAIKTVCDGATFLSSDVSVSLLKSLNQADKKVSHIKLTPREVEVLKLIAEEYSNQEIAETLYISSRTVDTHRRNLLEKLQLKNTAGLVKFAIQNGYVD
ncbi:MAG: response regulator transcription factor [Flavobacteriales bacterium]|nr:response regulator transcription factor [Flavobacteriales bacterium]